MNDPLTSLRESHCPTPLGIGSVPAPHVRINSASINRLNVVPPTLPFDIPGAVSGGVLAHPPQNLPVLPQPTLLDLTVAVVVLQYRLHTPPLPPAHHEVEGAESHLHLLQVVGRQSKLSPGIQPGSDTAHGVHHPAGEDDVRTDLPLSFVEVLDLGQDSTSSAVVAVARG